MQKNEKQKERRQMLHSLVLLSVVLGLAVICAVAYIHARGGFLR